MAANETDWKRLAAVVSGVALAISIFLNVATFGFAAGSERTKIEALERRADKAEAVESRITRLETMIPYIKESLDRIEKKLEK